MIDPTKEDLFKSKFAEFLAQFVDEKDRTAVILVSAKLEYHLGQAIAARLLPCSSGRDDLLENDGYLGTFEARISAAYRLGIIDDKFARALHLFRKMRNDFAHSYHDISFDDGKHRDRLHEMIRPLLHTEFYENVDKLLQKGSFSEAKKHFIISSAVLLGSLQVAPDVVKQISDPPTIYFR